MELEVSLTRSGDEPWGFRLIGGADFHMPLTVVKVLPQSPAEVAGLQNNDVVMTINGTDAAHMSHEDSKVALAGAGERLSLGVVRGLYDPVLDDYEPIYEPVDQDDFDQPSQPTEVPDYLDLTLTLPEFSNVPKGTGIDGVNGLFKPLPDLVGQNPETRSLTASPFVVPTKPYRPFSTEPLSEIPPLEDPLILNPAHQDVFGSLKDYEEFLPKTRFKLPISEQYDPDGTKKKMKVEAMQTKDLTTIDSLKSTVESKTVNEETMVKKEFEIKEQVVTKQEVKFLEEMKKEIDLETIEKTATSIVDESIAKALTVTEEIKREIDVELSESSDTETSKFKSEKETSKVKETNTKAHEVSSQSEARKEKSVKEVTELVELIDKTTEEIVKQNEHKAENKVIHVDQIESVVDSKQVEHKVSKTEEMVIDKLDIKTTAVKEDLKESQSYDQKDVQHKVSRQETKAAAISETTNKSHTSSTTTSESKSEINYSTSKLLAEQRAYTIGQKTIPNIRGTVHSSYHYDLLLRTFFIHLTDVMVALSRFILAEPVLSKSIKADITENQEAQQETVLKTEEIISVGRQKMSQQETSIKTDATVDTVSQAAEKYEEVSTITSKSEVPTKVVTHAKKEKVVGKILQKAHEIKEQEKQQKIDDKKQMHEQRYQAEEKHSDESYHTEEIVKRRELSGLKMAQLTEKKPEKLMQNMEAVLTEFESKSCNEDIEIVRERRSRSRSRVDTPVEMLQMEKSTQEFSERMTTSGMSNSMSESKTSRTSESGYETTEYDTLESADTYIAIVESHVYTNKDAIFDITKTTAVDSTEEKLRTTATDTISAEKVVTESLETNDKSVQAVVNSSTKMISTDNEDIIQVTEKTEQKSEAVIQEVKNIEEKVIQKVAKPVKTAQDVIIEEIMEPAVEEHESTFTQNYTVTEAKEESEISKSEFKEVSIVEEKTFLKQETETTKDEAISTSIKKENVALKEVTLEEKSIFVQPTAIVEVKKEEAVIVKEAVKSVESITKVEDEKPVVLEELSVMKEEIAEIKEVAIVKEPTKEIAKEESVPVEQEVVKKPLILTQSTEAIKEKDELPTLKICEEQTIKESSLVEVDEQVDVSIKKVEINNYESTYDLAESHIEQESTFVAKSLDQESTFIAKSVDSKQIEKESSFIAISSESNYVEQKSCSVTKSINQESVAVTFADTKENQKLSLRTDIAQKVIESQVYEEGDLIKTPTPSTVPPTPMTDEYIFSLVAKLPKREGTPIPRDCTPSDDDDEDPHIVKKGLVPNIEANIEAQRIFDPPLPTPPTSPKTPTSPVYTKPGLGGGVSVSSTQKIPRYIKPGLRGGAPIFPRFPTTPKTTYIKPGLRGGADQEYSEEEIKEIELKSSLLASAIDQTIKSIEEYKEEVGMKKAVTTESSTEVKKEETVQNGVMYNGYAKVVETKVFDSAILENGSSHDTNAKELRVHEETKTVEENNVSQKQDMNNGFFERTIGATIECQPKENRVLMTPQLDIKSDENFTVENMNQVVVQNSDMNGVMTREHTSNINMKPEEKVATAEKKHVVIVEEKRDPMEGYKPVPFDPEELNAQREQRAALGIKIPYLTPSQEREMFKTPSGDIIGTHKGIVDGLEEAIVEPEAAKEMGKPGITEEKIAELISGEAEMLREAHVMGLSRVLASHMHRADDDSSVDFNKIKPIVESLKDSEVLKALNEELLKEAEERKKKEEKKSWTTFLQKPKRPVPKSKFGYYKDMEPVKEIVEPYKPKIVKQPKPKVAPDYKPKDFNTGLLPWEERALREPTPPPVDPEEPILIPEEAPEILEAVDPLPESEVPDLEDSGIPLPPPPEPKEASPAPEEAPEEEAEELNLDAVLEETEKIVEENLVEEMDRGNIAEQIMTSVQNMVDPNAPLEQQLAQMRAQLAALAQLPGVIQQSLELVTRQLSMLSQVEGAQKASVQEMPEADMTPAAVEETEVSDNGMTVEEVQDEVHKAQDPEPQPEQEPEAPTLTPEEVERMRREEELMLEEQRKMEKQKKELMEQARIEHESRQVKQRPTPRVGNPLPDPRVGSPAQRNGKPKPVFGPAAPWERPVVLPGGRKWRTPKDAYNDAFIAETLQAQAELIAGKAMGCSYESVLLPYDQRVNFMKYEKPPVSLDHLKDSDTYKLVHNMETSQPKRVEMLTPVMAECDYREKCRSMTPCSERRAQQVQP